MREEGKQTKPLSARKREKKTKRSHREQNKHRSYKQDTVGITLQAYNSKLKSQWPNVIISKKRPLHHLMSYSPSLFTLPPISIQGNTTPHDCCHYTRIQAYPV
jgi:hypothetical protein